jgi:hypothetical protein
MLMLSCRHETELKRLQSTLDLQHQRVMAALRKDLEEKLQDMKSCASEDLEMARQHAAGELQALKAAAAQDHSAAELNHAQILAAREQAHGLEIDKLRGEHTATVEHLQAESRKAAKEAAQQLLQEKQRAAADIKTLQA